MENKKIGVDIDEVLASLIHELTNFYNSIYKTNFSFEDYHTYDLEDTWGGTKERSVKIVDNFYSSLFFRNIKPIDGSQKSIKVLSGKHDLIAITSRPNFMQRETESWIEKYFPRQIKKIICTGQYFLKQNKISKSDVCLEENAHIIIEDNYQTAFDCSKNGLVSFLLNKPWNKNSLSGNGVVRVNSWKEILEKIKLLEIERC